MHFTDGSETQFGDDFLEQRVQDIDAPQRLRAAPVRIHDPFDPIHIGEDGAIVGRDRIRSRICWFLESAYHN